LKLQTARLAVHAASEAIELIGGSGYIEECITARFFRDAQVLPVWEGTTNILYLDALRWILKEGAHRAVLARCPRAHQDLDRQFDSISSLPAEEQPLAAKRCCDALWKAYAISRLEAASDRNPRLAAVVDRLMDGQYRPLSEQHGLIVRGAMR
jgi:hypothetical protein